MDLSNKFNNLEAKKNEFKTPPSLKPKPEFTPLNSKIDYTKKLLEMKKKTLTSIDETNWMFNSNIPLTTNFTKHAVIEKSALRFL